MLKYGTRDGFLEEVVQWVNKYANMQFANAAHLQVGEVTMGTEKRQTGYSWGNVVSGGQCCLQTLEVPATSEDHGKLMELWGKQNSRRGRAPCAPHSAWL